MRELFTLFLLGLLIAASPAWAQSHRSVKSRPARLAAGRATREKAERTRRAEAVAKAAAAALPLSIGPDADELMRIEEAWAQATIHNHTEVITHLLADEYVAVNSLGLATTKADVLAAIANDEAQCDINEPFEYIMRVYGNAGLVIHNTSFRSRLNGTLPTASTSPPTYR